MAQRGARPFIPFRRHPNFARHGNKPASNARCSWCSELPGNAEHPPIPVHKRFYASDATRDRPMRPLDPLSRVFAVFDFSGVRSDNGPEFVAKAVQEWITAVGAKTAYITLGSPWENGYVESFNARLRDELLDGEIFYTLREAQIVIESWRRHFNTIRPHASLGYKPPAPEVFVPAFAAWPAALRQPASLATLAPRLVLN